MKKIIVFLLFLLSANTAHAKLYELTVEPDTCSGCMITFELDDEKPQQPGVWKRVIKGDPAYAGTPLQDQLALITRDNKAKNDAVATIIKEKPSAMLETDPLTGSLKVKDSVSINWGYDQNRKVNVRILKRSDMSDIFTPAEKATLRAAINRDLGNGKANIN